MLGTVMLDSIDLAALDLATQSFSQVLGSLDVAVFDSPTVCGDWTVRDVANHVCGGALRYAHYLRGGMPEDIAWTRTSDNVGNDPPAAHDNLSAELRTLFTQPAVVFAIADRLAQPAGEWHPFRPPPLLRTAYPRS